MEAKRTKKKSACRGCQHLSQRAQSSLNNRPMVGHYGRYRTFIFLLVALAVSLATAWSTYSLYCRPLYYRPKPLASMSSNSNGVAVGKLEEMKQREAELIRSLDIVRQEKLALLRQRPLTIGIVGFGRFGQFMARTFVKQHHKVVAISRSDYSDVAQGMGVTHISGMNLHKFLQEDLDVIVLAVSIMSFRETVLQLAPSLLEASKNTTRVLPLVVDVLSVKEHPRNILLTHLPKDCDILCTHPMFGPDSAQHGWSGLNFVYERTRIDGVTWDCNKLPPNRQQKQQGEEMMNGSLTEGKDRVERFLSIWEEEGCRMVQLSCVEHDEYAANSQFITHLMGRILGKQGLSPTPIDTKGFENVLKLVQTTTADSFDLFYGLYKYNPNSMDTVNNLRSAMDEVVLNLKKVEEAEPN